MRRIAQARREWFGGLVFSEHPASVLFVDHDRADDLRIARRDDLRPGVFSAPLDVHLCLTNRCSLRCPGCYVETTSAADPAQDMTRSRAQSVLDALARLHVFTVAFGGGEPFLHPQLFEIAAYARAKGIVPNITTNGCHIDDANARRCAVFGNIHLSCHSVADLAILDAPLNRLRACGIQAGLNVLATSETLADFPAIFAWGQARGVARVLILKFKTTAANRPSSPLRLSSGQEAGLLPLIKRLARKHRLMPLIDCSLFPALAVHQPPEQDVRFFDVNGCQGGNAFLAVMPDGQFKPCSFWPHTFGNVTELTPEGWFSNPGLVQFRKGRRHVACGQCHFLDLCNGGCPLEAEPLCQIHHRTAVAGLTGTQVQLKMISP